MYSYTPTYQPTRAPENCLFALIYRFCETSLQEGYKTEFISKNEIEIGAGTQYGGKCDEKALISCVEKKHSYQKEYHFSYKIIQKQSFSLLDKIQLLEGKETIIGIHPKLEFCIISKDNYNKGIDKSQIYSTQRQIGGGSFSNVYLGINRKTNELVTIKELKSTHAKTPFKLKNFKQEISILMNIFHPHISKYIDHFQNTSNDHFLIMEYYPQTLHGYLQSCKRDSNGYVNGKIVKQLHNELFSAIHYLHTTCKLIHRDIKCENIMISNNGNVKLIDFGLCMRISESRNEENKALGIGTPEYISPENRKVLNSLLISSMNETIEKKKVAWYSEKSDCWAVGIVLFYLVTGKFEIRGDQITKTILEEVQKRFQTLNYDENTTIDYSYHSFVMTTIKAFMEEDPELRDTTSSLYDKYVQYSSFVEEINEKATNTLDSYFESLNETINQYNHFNQCDPIEKMEKKEEYQSKRRISSYVNDKLKKNKKEKQPKRNDNDTIEIDENETSTSKLKEHKKRKSKQNEPKLGQLFFTSDKTSIPSKR